MSISLQNIGFRITKWFMIVYHSNNRWKPSFVKSSCTLLLGDGPESMEHASITIWRTLRLEQNPNQQRQGLTEVWKNRKCAYTTYTERRIVNINKSSHIQECCRYTARGISVHPFENSIIIMHNLYQWKKAASPTKLVVRSTLVPTFLI